MATKTTWDRTEQDRVDAKTSIWKTPASNSNKQHYTDTSSPQDLFMNPEDIGVVPGEVQDGMNDWKKADMPTSEFE